MPFDALRPEWKVLAVDGVNLLDRAADLAGYPLRVGVGLHGPADAVDAAGRALAVQGAWRVTNRDPARMTVLAMTGVTALARVTARRMDEVDVTYPAGDILPVLEQADILHVSNEVSFSPDCQPDYRWTSMSFCARASYFDLLTHIGVDVVELTGNHLNDYGTAGLDYSLGLFEAAGMGVFGGGRNLEAARAPWRTEHNGNTFAFVGCNPVGPPNAYATADRPGAAPCDYGALRQQIGALAGEVDVVVVTQQYWEFDHANPTPQQVEDFSSLARAGADIVSGSQAHQPQGLAFVEGRFVHYGLGNLFFDQMQAVNLREMFIDLHVIYEGRHISTALFTGMLEDFARPRPMTPDERRDFLGRLFDAPPLCAAQ
ncbi:MAG: CapA family protein [Anaerolineae bacterium]|nr:CapA family protein [Anaerolineae bacterium]